MPERCFCQRVTSYSPFQVVQSIIPGRRWQLCFMFRALFCCSALSQLDGLFLCLSLGSWQPSCAQCRAHCNYSASLHRRRPWPRKGGNAWTRLREDDSKLRLWCRIKPAGWCSVVGNFYQSHKWNLRSRRRVQTTREQHLLVFTHTNKTPRFLAMKTKPRQSSD